MAPAIDAAAEATTAKQNADAAAAEATTAKQNADAATDAANTAANAATTAANTATDAANTITNSLSKKLDSSKINVLSEDEYTALTTKEEGKIYFIYS